MNRSPFRSAAGLGAAFLLLFGTGCIDALREGFSSGVESGVSGAIEAVIQGLLGLFLPA